MKDLELVNVGKHFVEPGGARRSVLSGLSLKLEAGSFTCLLGPSGCGKSTVLHLLAGFERPSAGEVRCGGCPVLGPGPTRPVIFQEPGLFPWCTALGNVLFALKASGRRGPEAKEIAVHYLSLVGLQDALHQHPHQLSGGMKQRVAIARALAVDPDVLLLDEPFSALDTFTRYRLQDELLRLWKQRRSTVVFVTHDIDEAVILAQRVVLLSPVHGRISGDIPIRIPRPADRTGSHFLGARREVFSAFHLIHEEVLEFAI